MQRSFKNENYMLIILQNINSAFKYKSGGFNFGYYCSEVEKAGYYIYEID